MELRDGLISTQYGFVNRTQGIELFGEAGFKRRVRDGDLVRELRGLYRVAGSPTSAEQQLYLVTFAYNGFASHRAAGALHGFQRYEEIRLEITVKAGIGSRKRLIGDPVTIHRSNLLADAHIEIVRGIPCTSLARTICDLSLYLGQGSLGVVLDDAKRRRLVTYGDVAACRDDLRARGRRRTTVIDELLRVRGVDFDPGDSEPELRLRSWLEDAGLPPVVQHPVIVNGVRRVLDLAYPDELVAVEYQGLDGHGLPLRVISDSRRTTELQLAGWLVVLITKGTTKQRAIEMVREALALRGRT